ncbi:MAG: 2-phospho-L-lactate guanylyltransferase [Actinomycetota bacterium]|nr:2-phospho-L-lactate guanylyltransferase [Actinomycetota bacterium]
MVPASQASHGWLGPVAVLVPVKAFGEAKLRLAPVLTPERRSALARRMAEAVLRSARGLPVAVVCDDREVAGWARSRGALVVWAPGRGLDRAVQLGVGHLGAAGAAQVIVAASDLPLADDLTWVADFAGTTLVADRRGDGTNVISVPTAVAFNFSYGPGSFSRHLAEARRTGRPVRVVRAPELAWDVDVPDDLSGVPGSLLRAGAVE